MNRLAVTRCDNGFIIEGEEMLRVSTNLEGIHKAVDEAFMVVTKGKAAVDPQPTQLNPVSEEPKKSSGPKSIEFIKEPTGSVAFKSLGPVDGHGLTSIAQRVSDGDRQLAHTIFQELGDQGFISGYNKKWSTSRMAKEINLIAARMMEAGPAPTEEESAAASGEGVDPFASNTELSQVFTLDMVMKELQHLAGLSPYHKERALDILRRYGAEMVSEIPEASWGEVIQQAKRYASAPNPQA